MELTTDSSEIPPTRSPLFIDLNEIPAASSSSPLPSPPPPPPPLPPAGTVQPDQDESESVHVVRSFHDGSDPAPGLAAGLPAEVAGGCGVCGRPEVEGHAVVCDGCERGFHLGCAGMGGRQAVHFIEWLCGECASNGVKSKLWPLGVKSKRILDINAPPPSDGDVETKEERRHATSEASFGRNMFGATVAYPNHLYAVNGFGLKQGSGLLMQTFRVGFEKMLHHNTESGDLTSENIGLGSPIGTLRSITGNDNSSGFRFPSQNPSEMFLQGLREFITERHGSLEDGWRVEFKHSPSGYDVYAVYCSPNGMTFGSMSEVACHLGLMPNGNLMDPDRIQESLHLPKKRKSKRSSLANGFPANGDGFLNGFHKEFLSNRHSEEIGDAKFVKVTKDKMEGDGITTSQPSTEGLPIKFEDFFILTLGKIDLRPSYHDASMIWPIGYRSCWHDKVTGSLFVSEVADGGDSGPVFKIKRFSCSLLPVPDDLTVLLMKNQLCGPTDTENTMVFCNNDGENDGSFDMILADAFPPTESDVVACLQSCSNGIADDLHSSSLPDTYRDIPSSNLVSGEVIGEISVEESSSSSAWGAMTQKLLDAYGEIFREKGNLKFFCNHADNEMGSSVWDAKAAMFESGYASLAKFWSSPRHVRIPKECHCEPDTWMAALLEWLGQDRFGLDAEFVQEMIEQLPRADACLKYDFLINRAHYSASLTVGSGLLTAKRKYEAEPDDSIKKCKMPRLAEDCVMGDDCLPSGKALSSRLPPVLVGDFHQVWELLYRFHEILGLGESFSYEHLEEELINPWSNASNIHDIEWKGKQTPSLDLDRVENISGQMSSACHESCLDVCGGNSHMSIQVETGTSKNATQTRVSSAAHSGCCGVALKKVHSSLLGVLVSELQSKVAALVDPNFDPGDPKPKRGRRKDVDISIPARASKLSMLPINELTWPELARRYMLAVLAMDGNLDSAEITAREGGKVFRCLQGDGGVLCGSLTGIASMEADALLLAEATKKVFGSLMKGKDVITLEEEVPDVDGACDRNNVNDGRIPEWAQVLEPVRKLPTNVGTRIRNCVHEALKKCPPEWAKERLEHSISKGVYKGNASGPTKKAVLSVLADVISGEFSQKSDNKRNRRKIVISKSDIIMKNCRIVLRRAAATDGSKNFCTLLGRSLVSSCDNDDEGLLGSPAMVSRPLDFRTIDLRLAVGAYGGSHESFLEDVRELWNHLRSAFADQPDLVKLAETLSQNFDSLYEKEVPALVQKLEQYSKLDCLNAERKEEIDDVLASSNEIPKAPWDEGVCKVCGVDRDDNSVLLCDTCDAEYHTYCLNPPLVRIPEGNWYCPSCAVSKCKVQDVAGNTQVIVRSFSKKYQGEVTRVFLEALAHLAVVLEEKEYWQFSVEERMNLLKFLCDELLNSVLIRQHLEQSAEATAELQQKLRSLSTEWKNLKAKEEFLSLRAANMDTCAVGEVGVKEGLAPAEIMQGKGADLSDGHNHHSSFSDDLPGLNGQDGSGTHSSDKLPSASHAENNNSCDIRIMNIIDSGDSVKDAVVVADDSRIPLESKDRPSVPLQSPPSNHLPQQISGTTRNQVQGNLEGFVGSESSSLIPPPHNQGSCPSSETNADQSQRVLPSAMNESQAHHLELNSVENDIVRMQDSISRVESEIFKVSLRRKFLGSDSRGHLYWASLNSGGSPRIIVDRSLTLQCSERANLRLDNGSAVCNSSPSCIGAFLEGSQACFPFVYNPNDGITMCSSWVSYETESEIKELISCLKVNNQKEKELRESISQWQRLRYRDVKGSGHLIQEEHQETSSLASKSESVLFSDGFVTKAAMFLEKKYGLCVGLEAADISKKQSKKARIIGEEKMHRCDCLESMFSPGHHCLSCHKTFWDDVEFVRHNDGRCNSAPPACKNQEMTDGSLKVHGNVTCVTTGEEFIEVDLTESSKSGSSELSSRVIKHHDTEMVCPYDLREISAKFITKDSNKELIQEIGLIGTNWIPSFVTSISPCLDDAILMLIPPLKERSALADRYDADEKMILSEGNCNGANPGHESVHDNSSMKATGNEASEVLGTNEPNLVCLELKDKKTSLNKEIRSASCCVVPQSSLRPLIGQSSHILRRLKMDLLDMEAALPESALKQSKAQLERRWAWREHVKAANSIYEMIQATVILEEMIKTEYLRNEWWYWSSLSAAAKTSTVSSLALRIHSLDAAIIYEKAASCSDPTDLPVPGNTLDQKALPAIDALDKGKGGRKSNRKRKEPEG